MNRFFLTALVVCALSPAWGDTIVLKDGTQHNGTFISGTSTTITFRDETGVRRRFNLRDLSAIEFGPSGTSTGAGSRITDNSRDRVATTSNLRTLPAGTEVQIRTNQEINSDSAAEGRSYSAQVEKDVVDSTGTVIIPRGSEVELVVSEVKDPGTVSEAELTLGMRAVNINGRRYLINTAPLEQSSKEGIGKNRRTAEMVGGGAAIGTVIGAIAGGGRGALIGAIIGAVGGGAAQVLTKGKKVQVPAETVLTFRLDQAIQLDPAR